MRSFRQVCLVAIVVGVGGLSGRTMAANEKSGSGGQSEQMFQKEITKTVSLKYLLYLPNGYGQKKDQKWPLLLFLHGAGERGTDINLVKKHGPPKLIDQGKEFPFIIVSPQGCMTVVAEKSAFSGSKTRGGPSGATGRVSF